MSRDELRDGQPVLTAPWAKQMELVKSFNGHCDEATRVVLSRLASALDMGSLEDRHALTEPSETGLKLIFEPAVPFAADVLENKHRDSGTLTMLFYDSWSMHICHSGDHDDMDDDGQRQWVFVPPPPEGCALVHGASSLTRLSGGRLRAPLHRVTQPADGARKRYFLSYFLRPDHRLREEWVVADGASAGA
jgi:isopenicillin N synthase-like dioxygenase